MRYDIALVVIAFCLYWSVLIITFSYIIFVKGYSPWWYLFMLSISCGMTDVINLIK